MGWLTLHHPVIAAPMAGGPSTPAPHGTDLPAAELVARPGAQARAALADAAARLR